MPPVGFKRSRALWDEARRPREKKTDEWKSLLNAILYELQPIRFSNYSNQLSPSAITGYCKTRVLPFVTTISTFLVRTLLPLVWSTIRNLTPRQWMIVAGVVGYYFVVRWIHELLDAGPLVLIITALVAIFTIGLRDKADGELSAYSVFNRGFQRLMGSVDVEQLINQHVGGGMMMGAMNANAMPQDMAVEHNNHNNNHRGRNHRHHPAENNEDMEEDDDSDTNDQGQQNRARKSGKKARRKNREEKVELKRQREAAMAMGFDGTGGQEEMMAMQRLIEEQVAADANANNNNQG